MKKLILIIIANSQFVGFSQEKIKYETVCFEDNAVETKEGKFNLQDGMAEKTFVKGKLKVTNYTDKTLVIKPNECSFTSPQGDIPSNDKWMVIAPRDQEAKVIDAKGYNMKCSSTTLKINGLYICNSTEIITAPNMPLPPEKEMRIGNFALILDTWDRDGKEIMIRYKVKYLGEKIGMFTPDKVILKSPEGNEYKNQKEKEKTYALKQFDDRLFTFIYLSDSKKDNILDWKDSFSEGVPEKINNVTIDVKMDLGKTKDKN